MKRPHDRRDPAQPGDRDPIDYDKLSAAAALTMLYGAAIGDRSRLPHSVAWQLHQKVFNAIDLSKAKVRQDTFIHWITFSVIMIILLTCFGGATKLIGWW